MNMYKALDELARAEKRIKELEGAIQKFENNPIGKHKFLLFDLMLKPWVSHI